MNTAKTPEVEVLGAYEHSLKCIEWLRTGLATLDGDARDDIERAARVVSDQVDSVSVPMWWKSQNPWFDALARAARSKVSAAIAARKLVGIAIMLAPSSVRDAVTRARRR